MRGHGQAHDELFGLRAELRELWAQEEPDLEVILAKQAEMNEVRARLRAARAEFGVAALEQLSPEQRAAHSELMMQRTCPHAASGASEPASAEPARTRTGVWL